MGAAQSSALERINQQLAQLSGPASLAYGDDFWHQLFSSVNPHALISLPPEEVEECLHPHCQQLLVHNPLTHNFQVLVLHVVNLLGDAMAPQPRNRRLAANGLHLVWAVLKVAGESGNGSSLVHSLFQITPNLPLPQHLAAASEPGSQQLLRLLVRRCVNSITCIPPRDTGYLVLVEVLQLLLVLLACTQLRAAPLAAQHSGGSALSVSVQGPPGTHPGLEALCSFQQAAPQVVSGLLQLYISRPAPPPEAAHLAQAQQQEGGAGAGGILASAASMASTLLWLPVTTVSAVLGAGSSSNSATGDTAQLAGGGLSEGTPLCPSPLADLSVLLLLLLLCAPDQPLNPYKWALRSLVDSGEDADAAAGAQAAGHGQQGGQDQSAGALTPSSSVAVHIPGRSSRADGAAKMPGSQGDGGEGSNGSTTPAPSTASPPQANVSYSTLYRALSRALLAPSLIGPAAPAEPSSAGGAAGVGTEAGTAASAQRGPSAAAAGAGLVSSGAEEAVLLLYCLTLGCAPFKEYVLLHPDPAQLLVPLLRALYNVLPQQQPRLLFMIQILFLVFSQDVRWCQRIHTLQLQQRLAWCKEAGISKGVSLGSLVLVVLLRTISTTWALHGAREDGAAHTNALVAPANALAALANMALHCTALHARAAQRLLALLQGLTKRYTRMGGVEPAPLALSAALSGSSPADHLHASQVAQLSMVEDYLRVLLEVINLLITGPTPAPLAEGQRAHSQPLGAGPARASGSGSGAGRPSGALTGHSSPLASNLALVYALLHQQQVVAALRGHPRLGDLAENLQVVIDFFNFRLDQATGVEAIGGDSLPLHGPSASQGQGGLAWSDAQQVLGVLANSLPAWRPHHIKQLPQIGFTYEEDAEPHTFFMPYAWDLIMHRCSSVCWVLPVSAFSSAGEQLGIHSELA